MYVIEHPVTGVPFYAGKTENHLCDRLKTHVYYARKGTDAASEPIMKILAEGLRPFMRLLETVEVGANWCVVEIKWIAYYRAISPDTMCNKSRGGHNSSYGQSEESNAKRRATMLAKRQKQSDDQTARWKDPEYRQRVTRSMVEREGPSETTREKLSKKTSIAWNDPVIREKRHSGIKVAHKDAGYRSRRSASQTEKWANPEYRAMMAKRAVAPTVTGERS